MGTESSEVGVKWSELSNGGGFEDWVEDMKMALRVQWQSDVGSILHLLGGLIIRRGEVEERDVLLVGEDVMLIYRALRN